MSGIDATELKIAARNRWRDMFASLAGVSLELTDGKGHPCPRCGGQDRFRLIDAERGAVHCRKCDTKCGDGLASLQWLLGVDFQTALTIAADFVGLRPTEGSPRPKLQTDLIQQLANVKGCTREGLAEYGAEIDREQNAVVFPFYDETRRQCDVFTIWPNAPKGSKRLKGLCTKGGKSGLFLPFVDQGVHYPVAGETWIICEGVKDSAAWYSLGYHCCGTNGKELRQQYVPLFAGVNVILAPDRSVDAERAAEKTAARLYGVAASIRICHLPLPIKED